MCKGCREGYLAIDCACLCESSTRNVTLRVGGGASTSRSRFWGSKRTVHCQKCEHIVVSSLPDKVRRRQMRNGALTIGVGAAVLLTGLAQLEYGNVEAGGLTRFTFIFLIIIGVSAICVGVNGTFFGMEDPEEAQVQLG